MRYKIFESENSKNRLSQIRIQPYFHHKKPKVQRKFEFEPSLISYQSQTENSFQQAARSQSKALRNRSFVKEKICQTENKKQQNLHHHSNSVDVGFQVNLKNLLAKKKQSILISQKQDDSIDLSLSKINKSRANFSYKKQNFELLTSEIQQLQEEVSTEKQIIEQEMKEIYCQMQIVQKKHENAFPKVSEKDYRFKDLQNLQEQNFQQLVKFQDYLKQLRILKEKSMMASQELFDVSQKIVQYESQKNTLQNEVQNLDEIFYQLENQSRILEKKISNKQNLETIQQKQNEFQKEIFVVQENLQKERQKFFKETQNINNIMEQKTQNYKDCLEQKNEIIRLVNLNFVSKNFVLDKAQEISKLVQEQFCNKISQYNFDLDIKYLQEIQEQTQEEIKKISKLDLVKKETIECVYSIRKIFFNFIEQTAESFQPLINKMTLIKQTQESIERLEEKYKLLNKQIQEVQNQIEQELDKIQQDKQKHESRSSIDFDYLSESLTEDYFQTLRSSLNQLQIQKKIGDKKLQQQMEDFETKICKIEFFQEKINQLKNKQKNLQAQIQKTLQVIDECSEIKIPFVQEILNVLKNEQQQLHDFVENLPSLYQKFNLQDKINNIITNHYELNEDVQNFLETHIQNKEEIFNEDLNFGQIIDTKQKLLELNNTDQDIYKEQWNNLKDLIEQINKEKMPKLEKKRQKLKNLQENLQNKNPSNKSIIVDQSRKQTQIHIKKELVKNIIINLQNHFDFSKERIIQHLSNGFEIYLKLNFNKEFNLLKYIELIQIKKIRTSLQKFGFVKKFLKFDFVFNQINIYDLRSQKVDKIPFEDFYQFEISKFTDKMIKTKMPENYPIQTLNIYSQKVLRLLIGSTYSEILFKKDNTLKSFVCHDFYSFLCMLIWTRMETSEESLDS